MKKNILVVSQYFYPEQFRINDICEQWVKDGYKVTVLTGIPNYPKGDFYEGYGINKKRKDTWQDVEIIRLPIIPRKSGKILLAFNYVSFVFSGLIWSLFTKFDADIVFIYQLSPVTLALPGIWYSRVRKKPCFMYVLDLWPESVESVLNIHNKTIVNMIGKLVDYIYKRCDRIFVSSQQFIGKIHNRGISTDKLEFWPQFAEDFYVKCEDKTMGEFIPQDGILNLTFAGNLGYAQGLEVLVDVAIILKKEKKVVRFNIIGDGRYKCEMIENVEKADVMEYFNFIEKRPAMEIPQFLSCSDVALITLARSDVFAMTIPAKLQSCMACGIPVIVAADGEIQNIVKQAECGFCSDAGDAEGLAKNILKYSGLSEVEKKQFAQKALEYSIKNYKKETLMKQMNKNFEMTIRK